MFIYLFLSLPGFRKSLFGHVSSMVSSTTLFGSFQFEDARDADDAIYGRDGYKFDGHRLRVRH